jgi:predicted dehydrogenase
MKNFVPNLKRRGFIKGVGLSAASCVMAPLNLFPIASSSERKIRIGIIGGRFGASFNFHEHPNCIVEAVSDLRKDRRDHLMKVYQCSKSYESLSKLLKDSKIDAVFIATPAPEHVKHVKESLNAGKHVLCAVPAAWTLEECEDLKTAVKNSGLTYMMAETTSYMQNTLSVRKFYKEGRFGDIFSAAAEYNHNGIENLFFEHDGTPTWRHGMPPLLYLTHGTSFLISITRERLTQVSAMGWGDDSPILKNNQYNNPFWNGTAFFKTDSGKPFRVETNWKGALRSAVRAEWRGDKMSFYSGMKDGDEHTLVHIGQKSQLDNGGFQYTENIVENYKQPLWWKSDMLPAPLRHDSGHDGSHTFITHEFIDSLINNRKPEDDVFQALAYTAPGIVAHQSALKDGEPLKIPNFDS